MATMVFGYSYFQKPRSSLSRMLHCASYFHGLSSLRYYFCDMNVATVTWLYQILTTLHISHDLRNFHCKHISELVCLWEFFDCTWHNKYRLI